VCPSLEGVLGRDVNPPGSAALARGWARARRDRVPRMDRSLTWSHPSGLCSFVLMGVTSWDLGVLRLPLIMVPDNPRRRPAHRRDPQDLSYTLDHLTGAVSPPVSPFAPFFLSDHCSIRKGPRVRFPETLGGFLQSRRLMWIVHRGPVCNSLKNFRQGPQRKTVFPLSISF
jgi:hypothetical protein